MRKPQLEAALRAAANASGEKELVLAGSQSVFGHTDDVPVEVLVSEECDVWNKDTNDKLSNIADTIGRGSPFHLSNGFFVDPVDPGSILLPSGWEGRLKPLRVGEVTAWCLDPTDLVVSTLKAVRLKHY